MHDFEMYKRTEQVEWLFIALYDIKYEILRVKQQYSSFDTEIKLKWIQMPPTIDISITRFSSNELKSQGFDRCNN